jgi:hypothetical protein
MATPSNAEFLVSYPEFSGASSALLTAKLAEAGSRTNRSMYQTEQLATYATMLSAALLLLRTPAGMKMRTESPDMFLTWEYELKKAQRAATIGVRVFAVLGGLLPLAGALSFSV